MDLNYFGDDIVWPCYAHTNKYCHTTLAHKKERQHRNGQPQYTSANSSLTYSSFGISEYI